MDSQKTQQTTPERLRFMIDELGISMRQMASCVGINPNSGTRIVKGLSGLTWPMSYALELRLGYRAEWLQTGTLPMRTETPRPLPLEILSFWKATRPDAETAAEALRTALIQRMNQEVSKRMMDFTSFVNQWGIAGKEDTDVLAQREQEEPVLKALFGEWMMLLEHLKQKPLVSLRRSVILALWWGEKDWGRLKGTADAYNNLQATFTLKAYKPLEKEFQSVLEAFWEVEKQMKPLLQLTKEQRGFLKETTLPHKKRLLGMLPPQKDSFS